MTDPTDSELAKIYRESDPEWPKHTGQPLYDYVRHAGLRAVFDAGRASAAAGVRAATEPAYPKLLSIDEQKALIAIAKQLWSDLQNNELGGFSGINRPFWIFGKFKEIIEQFGTRDVGLQWSKNQIDAALRSAEAPTS